MKQKFIRILALIITVVLLAITLCACKPSQKQEDVQSTASGGNESQGKEEETVKATADVRIMSYNILNPEWTNSANGAAEDRIKFVRDIIIDYAPDVIGLQEASYGWHAALEVAMCENDDYRFACKFNNTERHNMTTFLYNSKTLKLVDEYVIDIVTYSDIRVVSVAVFEKLSDDTRFVVTNAHPAPPGQTEDYIRHMTYIPTVLKYELKKYKDLPVILTGDFNTREQSEYYESFMKDTGVKDAKYEAKKILHNYSTFVGLNNPPREGNWSCIDHIFINDKATVELFDVIIDHDAQKASDHLPIYADIILKKR